MVSFFFCFIYYWHWTTKYYDALIHLRFFYFFIWYIMWVLWIINRGLTRSLQSEETDDQTKWSKKNSTLLALIRHWFTWSLQKSLQDDRTKNDTIDFSYALWDQLRKTFSSSDELSEHIFDILKNGFNDLLAQNVGQNKGEAKKDALIKYYQGTIYNIFDEETQYSLDITSSNHKKILEIKRYYLDNQENIMSLLINIPWRTLDKPADVTDYEKHRTNKVTELPKTISLKPVIINWVNFPAFSDSLVDYKTRNPWLNDDQNKQSYEWVVKQAIANRANEWIKQHVSYAPNYKGCCDIWIVIHHPKLNNGDGAVVYTVNKPDYIKDIQTKNNISDKQAQSSIKEYTDHITSKQWVVFFKRTFSDANNIVLDVKDPDNLIDSNMSWAKDSTDPNLLKLVLEDIAQQDQNCDSIFQWFTDIKQLTPAIASDCGFGTDPKDELSLILTQYIINGWFWYWNKSKVDGANKNASYCYLFDVNRWLNSYYLVSIFNSPLCTDYLVPSRRSS